MKSKKRPHGKRLGKLKNGGVPCDIRALPKCQATAKHTGKRCGNIAMRGKCVCYLHGGKSPGGKAGNQNAFKHGEYTVAAIAERQLLNNLIKESNKFIDQI